MHTGQPYPPPKWNHSCVPQKKDKEHTTEDGAPTLETPSIESRGGFHPVEPQIRNRPKRAAKTGACRLRSWSMDSWPEENATESARPKAPTVAVYPRSASTNRPSHSSDKHEPTESNWIGQGSSYTMARWHAERSAKFRMETLLDPTEALRPPSSAHQTRAPAGTPMPNEKRPWLDDQWPACHQAVSESHRPHPALSRWMIFAPLP